MSYKESFSFIYFFLSSHYLKKMKIPATTFPAASSKTTQRVVFTNALLLLLLLFLQWCLILYDNVILLL